MKTVSCDMCDAAFTATTFEDWMVQMKPHYMSEHADFMEAKRDLPEDKAKEEGMKWIADNKARFDAV